MKVSTSVITKEKEGEIEFEKASCKSMSSGNPLRGWEGRDISYYVFFILESSQSHILDSISRIWYHHGHWHRLCQAIWIILWLGSSTFIHIMLDICLKIYYICVAIISMWL